MFLLGPTGILAVNIGVTTIHFGFGIKRGTKLFGLNDKSKPALKQVNRGEIINNRWTVADLLQLPPVKRKLLFSQFSDKDSMKHL